MKVTELSAFFPAYNEEGSIRQTVIKAAAVLPEVAKKWEITVVNDGSTDQTGPIIEELIAQEKRIRLITHTLNQGFGAALKSGLYNSAYEWIVYSDSDGQFDFQEVTNFLEKQKETKADLVVGYYLKRAVPLYRKWGSWLWEAAVFSLFGLRVKDIDCGFKLIRKEVLDKIPYLEAERGPFISTELLVKAKKAGFKIVGIGVHHYPRRAGKATGASLKVILSGLTDLFKLRRKLK